MSLTVFEKLKWIQEHALNTSLESYEERAYYEPVQDDAKHKMIVYTSTPIGFLVYSASTVEATIESAYDALAIRREHELYVPIEDDDQ